MMGCPMTKLFAGVSATAVICGTVFTSIAAAAASNVDKIALQKATADCRAQVKEYAQYHETSLVRTSQDNQKLHQGRPGQKIILGWIGARGSPGVDKWALFRSLKDFDTRDLKRRKNSWKSCRIERLG